MRGKNEIKMNYFIYFTLHNYSHVVVVDSGYRDSATNFIDLFTSTF